MNITLPTDCLVSGERALPGVFDTALAHAQGVFDISPATSAFRSSFDGGLLAARLRQIDEVLAADKHDLFVNDPAHRPSRRMAYIPCRMPTNATPTSSSALDDAPMTSYPLGQRPRSLQRKIDARFEIPSR